jgi:hypothetical protein
VVLTATEVEMKTRTAMLALALGVLALPAQAEDVPACHGFATTLSSDAVPRAGRVLVERISDTELRVTYTSSPPWRITEDQLSVVESPSNFPVSRQGCPYPCQFSFSEIQKRPVTSDSFEVDITNVAPGSILYFAARALVSPQPGGPTPAVCNQHRRDGDHEGSSTDDGRHCTRTGSGHSRGDHRGCERIQHGENDGLHCVKPGSGHNRGDHRSCEKDASHVYPRSDDGRHCSRTGAGHSRGDHRGCEKIQHSENDGLHCVKPGSGHSRGDHRSCEKQGDDHDGASAGPVRTRTEGSCATCVKPPHSGDGDENDDDHKGASPDDGRHCTRPGSGHGRGDHRDCEKDDDDHGGDDRSCVQTTWGMGAPFNCTNGAMYFACRIGDPPPPPPAFTKAFDAPQVPANGLAYVNSFSLAVTNTGAGINNVTFSDAVDSRLVLTGQLLWDPGVVGDCSASAGQSIACTIPYLPANQTARLRAYFYVPDSVAAGVRIENCASMGYDGGPTLTTPTPCPVVTTYKVSGGGPE